MIMTSRPAITTTRACLQHLDHAHIIRPSVYRRRISTRVDAPTNGTPKRASPYRLLTPTSFLSAFAPLHVQGWRLLPLPAASSSTSISDQHGDLQDRRIVRIYELDQASGWKRSKVIFDRVHDLSIELSHHPSVSVTPSADYKPPAESEHQLADDTAYVVEVSLNTHTPYAPVGQPKNAGKMRPGVTMKDVTLANAVEEAYRVIVRSDGI